MSEHPTFSITRRQFLAGLAAGGAALALGGCASRRGPQGAASRSRRIWVVSDCHVGLSGDPNDGRDGADWLALAVAEQSQSQPRPDYVLALGDLSHHARAEELTRFAAIRDAADLGPWFEIAGNHDFAAVKRGDWQRIVSRPTRYTLLDGNTAFILASQEQGSAAGLLSAATLDWLAGELDRYQDGNVVVCTHQPPADTVARSAKPDHHLINEPAIARLIEEHRIDLWLCGHIHSGPRTPGYVARRGRTTFVNVASAGHAYGTGTDVSYSFSGEEGSRTMLGQCRDHERGQFLPDYELRLELPKPWTLGQQAAPLLLPAKVGEEPPAHLAPDKSGDKVRAPSIDG